LEVDKQGSPEPLGKLLPDGLIEKPLLGLHISFIYDRQTSNVVFSSVELLIGENSLPVVIYKPQKRNIFGVESSSSPKTILKLDHINYEHSLWQSWWKKFGQLLPYDRQCEVVKLFEALEFHQFRRGWQKRLPRELVGLQASYKQSLEKIDEQNQVKRQQIEKQLRAIESLIRLWQHFENYTFEKAIKDLSKLSEYSSLLAHRNFLPSKTITLDVEKSSGSEIWNLSEVYKHRWKPDFSELTLLTGSIFRRFLENVIYIGPLRDYPERIYILSGNFSKEVGKSGKLLPDVLFKNRELLEQVNEQLERFRLGYELKVSPFIDETSGISDLFALRLIDKDTGVNVSIQDVGFGISQVLPIIVQSMLSRNSTLLIEQPEIHIHPRLQAELGSLLAECIKPPFENQFIIETHSEHLMLRLQKLIRKGELKPEDISVIYVDRGAEGSKCLHLRLDEEGDFIDEWPDGFFEEDFNEIFQ
jgi:hypothetical protein